MNLITGCAPDSVEIAGVLTPICTDFRVSIEVERLATSGAAQTQEGLRRVLALYFETPPPDQQAAMEAALWFFFCGKDRTDGGQQGKSEAPIYDYEFDAAHIYAAFLTQYNIDLQAVKHLHWWRFRALFDALPPTCTFCKIVGYRTTDTHKLKGEERSHYTKLKKLYALPVPEAEKQQLAEIEAWLRGEQ